MYSANPTSTATVPVLPYGSGPLGTSPPPPVASTRTHHAVIALPAEASRVCTARHFTTALLARWGVAEGDRDRAELIVSELAGNAARHGRTDMTMHLSLVDRGLCIDVIDTGQPSPARSCTTTCPDEAGAEG